MDLSAYLKSEVAVIASEIGERNYIRFNALEKAADHLESRLSEMGYPVVVQKFRIGEQTFRNVSAEIKGAIRPERIWIVGAHYDSVSGSPGANDNGSGVAAVLALAKQFFALKPSETVRFVFFANEEPPFFQTEGMGSWQYAKACRTRKEKILGMISLETLGYFSEKEGSQQYPGPLAKMYPSRGNFIALVGNPESKSFLEQVAETFRKGSGVPLETAAFPPSLPGLGWSDHWAFWQEGYPALMFTDTAPFRYPHYHLASDTPNRIDYEKVAGIVNGVGAALRKLSLVPE